MQWLGTSEERKVLRTLKRIAASKVPVDVEVERYNVRFPAVLGVRGNHLLISRPARVKGLLHKQGTLRFADPNAPGRVIRVEITHPAFVLTSGSVAIVCRLPSEFVEPNKRSAPRYNTASVRNLSLSVRPGERRYRIVDLSEHGCKLRFFGDPKLDPLVSGRNIKWSGTIVVGNVGIELESLQPRSVGDGTVGCFFRPAGNEDAQRRLRNLLRTLDRTVSTRITPSFNL